MIGGEGDNLIETHVVNIPPAFSDGGIAIANADDGEYWQRTFVRPSNVGSTFENVTRCMLRLYSFMIQPDYEEGIRNLTVSRISQPWNPSDFTDPDISAPSTLGYKVFKDVPFPTDDWIGMELDITDLVKNDLEAGTFYGLRLEAGYIPLVDFINGYSTLPPDFDGLTPYIEVYGKDRTLTTADKGIPNGLATLGADGKVLPEQLPDGGGDDNVMRGDSECYVDLAYTGAGDGTYDNPFGTLQEAFDQIPREMNGYVAHIYVESSEASPLDPYSDNDVYLYGKRYGTVDIQIGYIDFGYVDPYESVSEAIGLMQLYVDGKIDVNITVNSQESRAFSYICARNGVRMYSSYQELVNVRGISEAWFVDKDSKVTIDGSAVFINYYRGVVAGDTGHFVLKQSAYSLGSYTVLASEPGGTIQAGGVQGNYGNAYLGIDGGRVWIGYQTEEQEY